MLPHLIVTQILIKVILTTGDCIELLDYLFDILTPADKVMLTAGGTSTN